MIAVIFELTPAPGRKQEYLDLAAGLAAELKDRDGFISIERFESISNPGRFVSLSFWRDEEAVRKWRNVQKHREAQAKGRGGVFSAYRLRVADVMRDYTMDRREQAPQDSLSFHKPIHG
jgi:heme-degrading monooxygenase HmoA